MIYEYKNQYRLAFSIKFFLTILEVKVSRKNYIYKRQIDIQELRGKSNISEIST